MPAPCSLLREPRRLDFCKLIFGVLLHVVSPNLYFIQVIRGKQTVNYIDTIMTRITLPGSFFLAIVAILPALAMKFLGIQQAFAYFYGGTSLLIMVGVVLDTLKQIESYLLMRHYDGLMKTGRIQGRH